MRRTPQWDARLADLIAARRTVPFVWGINDCALFVADAIATMTGEDPAADLRGLYDSALGAHKAMQALVGRTQHAYILEALAEHMAEEFSWIPVVGAHEPGDVVVFKIISDKRRDRSAGIIGPDGLLWCVGQLGLKSIPLWFEGLNWTPVVRGWRIPVEVA